MATSSKPKATSAEPHVNESVYTVAELIDNHKVFNTSREIVAVALRLAGVKAASVTEATNIIEKFRNKEVK